MTRHLPTFHQLTAWQRDRTQPTWVECDCGWTSNATDDQTQAEWTHGAHLVDVGILTEDQMTAEVEAVYMAQPGSDCTDCTRSTPCWGHAREWADVDRSDR